MLSPDRGLYTGGWQECSSTARDISVLKNIIASDKVNVLNIVSILHIKSTNVVKTNIKNAVQKSNKMLIPDLTVMFIIPFFKGLT